MNRKQKILSDHMYWPLVVLAIIVAFLIYLQIDKTTIEKKKNEQSYLLYKIDQKIDRLDIECEKYKYFIISKDDSLYLNGTEKIKDSIRKNIISMFSDIVVETQISEKGEPTLSMGLSKPILNITATYDDTSSVNFKIGSKVPLTENYYFVSSKKEGIYAINGAYEDILNVDPRSLIDVENIALNPNNIESISIKKDSTVYEISIDEVADTYVRGDIVKPFIYKADPKKLVTLIQTLTYMDLGIDLDKEILDEKKDVISIIVKNKDGNILKLEFLKVDDFYTYINYKDKFYKASTISLSSIINFDVNDILTRYPFTFSSTELDNINLISVYQNGEEHKFDIENAQNGVSVYYDEKNIDISYFKDLLKSAMTMNADIIKDNIDTKNLELRKCIKIYISNIEHIINFYDKDAYYDYIEMDGIVCSEWLKENTNNILFVEE